jgi:hypothetical protein
LFARVGFTAVYDKKLADLSAKLAGERGSAAAAIQVRFVYLRQSQSFFLAIEIYSSQRIWSNCTVEYS